MAKKRIKQPTQINDEALDEVKGGLTALLLPAVQKVQATDQQTASHSGGVNVALGDGSVRKA